MLNKKTLKDVDLKGKKVIARLDFNVPIKEGKITDTKRIVATLPTLNYLIQNNCKIILLSHLSRIKSTDDIKSGKKSLKLVAEELQRQLPNNKVTFVDASVGQKVVDAANNLQPGEVILLENTRYNDVNENNEVVKKESKCDNELGKFWASLAEVYVNDAFGTAHRKHASNVGIAQNIGTSCIGFLVEKELQNLSKVSENPEKPFVAIMGGAKVSDKLKIVNHLVEIADYVLIGGGMVFTFLKAQGYDIGNSLLETEMIDEAKKILAKGGNKIILSTDAYCALSFEDTKPEYRKIEDGLNGLMGLDIGPRTIEDFKAKLMTAKSVVWNGPVGVSEFKNFTYGTVEICKILKEITAKGTFTVIGGGDSAAAAISLGFKESDFSFISTGGGASLALIEGSVLPGVEAIQNK